MTGITHVLSWLPARFTEDGSAAWELRTVEAWNAGLLILGHTAVCAEEPPSWDMPGDRDASPGDLARWVTEKVGFPVDMDRDDQQIRLPRLLARWQTVPVFYVRRAS